MDRDVLAHACGQLFQVVGRGFFHHVENVYDPSPSPVAATSSNDIVVSGDHRSVVLFIYEREGRVSPITSKEKEWGWMSDLYVWY